MNCPSFYGGQWQGHRCDYITKVASDIQLVDLARSQLVVYDMLTRKKLNHGNHQRLIYEHGVDGQTHSPS